MILLLTTTIQYSEERAVAFAGAIADILSRTDAQIIWKYQPFGEYSDDFLIPLEPYLGESGRLRMPRWLGADPYALLDSGHISLSVHHGGSGCYHEAIT